MNVLLHILGCWSGLMAPLNGFLPEHDNGWSPDSLGTAEVVVAQRTPGINTNAPLQRLDSTDIRLRGITDTGDALRRLAGVNLRDYGGAGGLKTVSVRGLGASHTRVAYDGLCLNDSRQGQIDLQRFNIDRLAGMELQVLDGNRLLCPVRNLGAATLYLRSQHATTSGRKHEGTASLKQSSFNTWNPSFGMKNRLGSRTFLSWGGDYFYADNDYPFYVENGAASAHLHRTNSQMQTITTEANVTHRLKNGRIDGKVFFHHNYRHLPGQVIFYVNENNERLTEQNAFAQAHWEQHGRKFDFFAAAKFNWEKSLYADFDNQYPGGVLRQHYWQRETYATAGFSYHLGLGFKAAYATDYAYASMNSNQKTDHHVNRNTWLHSVSLQWQSARWNLMARGLAHLYWNEVKGGKAADDVQRLTPSVSASFLALRAPFHLYLRAGYKESFRVPTFTEAYFYHLGSKDLRPELAKQLNAGITLQAEPASWWTLLSVTSDVYHNRVKNRIVSVPYNLFVWKTVNLGEVKTTGLDLTLESRWKPARRHTLVATASYTFQRSKDCTVKNSKSYGKQLPYTPKHNGSASLAWENPWVSLVTHTTYASERWSTTEHLPTTQVPAYNEWGFAAYRTFRFPHFQLDVRADLLNAFNERYEIVRRYPMPGRAYKLTCKFIF